MSYVYGIQAKAGGPVKIGRSKNPERRLVSLQSAHPIPLVIIARIDEEPGLETMLHHLLGAHRMHGEWFAPDASVFEALKLAETGGIAALLPEPGEVEYAEIPEIILTRRNFHPVPKLIEYITSPHMTATELANCLNVSVSTVTRIARGQQRASYDLMADICRKTNGAVTPNDFFGIAA